MAFNWKFWQRDTSGTQISAVRRGFFNRSAIRVGEENAMQVSAFNRGVVYISTQIAKLPWDVKDDKNKILGGSISNLLSLAPNPEMNAFTFRMWAVSQALIHGNSFSEIERDLRGQPVAIWPLDTRAVDLLRTNSGELIYRVSGGGANKEDVYLQSKNVFHVRNLHTKDGLLGQGLVAYASEALAITLAADQMASGIFNNGGIPSGVVSVQGVLSDEAFKRLKESWDEQNTGRKSGGTRILEEGAAYNAINVDPEMLQFLESRQFGVLEIARFLGIPPTKLFDVTAATYSNVENSNLEVATDTLDSWACNLEMEADVKILNYRYGGRFTELDLYAVFRGDMTTRSNYFKTMMSISAMTPNEIRAREGQSPYSEGDNFYIATNNFTPVNRMDEVIDAQIAKSKPTEERPVSEKAPDQLQEAAVAYLKNKKLSK